MTLPHKPAKGGDVHSRAVARLDAAAEARKRLRQESDAAQGGPDERTASIAVAEANEQVAAREAWVHYIEHGY